ncbi:MAG: hypothetical protein ACI4SM_01520 [Candidatus Gastranaerophilaceae bacterium]
MSKVKKSDVVFYIILGCIFLLGVVIRCKTYFLSRSLWLDEACLALNLLDIPLFKSFYNYDYNQFAPPIFMFTTRLLTIIKGSYSELVLRLIPFVCSLLSIFVFYVFSKQFLKNRFSILLVNFIFAINYYICYYSQEFKPYASDVLMFMISLLFFAKMNLYKLDRWRIFGVIGFCFLAVNISLPTLFVIGAWCIYSLLKFKKEGLKNVLIFFIPFTIIFVLYYFLYLAPARVVELDEFWKEFFLGFNLIKDLMIFKSNLYYYFTPNKLILFLMLLVTSGFYILLKSEDKLEKLTSFAVLLSLVASILKIYPSYERLSLFIIPVVIIMLVKPFDITKNIVLKSIILFFVILSLVYYNNKFIKKYFSNSIFGKSGSHQVISYVKEHYQPEDIIVYNKASSAEYLFYTKTLDFIPNKYIVTNLPSYEKELYFKNLSFLERGSYIFIVTYDYVRMPIREFLMEWLQDKNIVWTYKKNESFCIKVKL